jgi:hypothetical protein
MSAKHSYNSVSTEHLLKLDLYLAQQPWSGVTTPATLDDDTPLVASIKFVLEQRLAALSHAVNGTYEGAVPADVEWDDAQTLLNLQLQIALRHPDPAKREAARVLRRDMLKGQGTAQTKLSFESEVAHGVLQHKLAGQAPYNAYIQLLELGDLFVRIAAATDALHAAIQAGQAHGASRSERVTNATNALRASLQSAHRSLTDLAALAHSKPSRERALALRDALDALRT